MTNSISTFVPELDVVMNILALTTPVPHVFATWKAYSLAERFFSCPHAAKLVQSKRFIKPILIDIQNIPGAETRIHWESNFSPSAAQILIPEKYLQTTKVLRTLAYEIFNAQGNVQGTSLYQQASLGTLGIDSYARQSEEHELAKTQEHFELIKQCGNHWKMSPEELKTYTSYENQHPEMYLFIQEIACHTDFFRKEWVKKFQKIYCDKHPSDSHSCETKMTDLCNLDMLRTMPVAEKAAFLRERICKLFQEAHVQVKNDPSIRAAMQAKCPELLEKSSPQPIQEEL